MPASRKLPPWAVVLILVVIGLAVYANSLGNQMFWDDELMILKNQHIKDWQYFPRLFIEHVTAGSHYPSNYWRPLLLAIFSVEWHLWRDWVYGWHAISTITHVAAGVALYFLINRLTAGALVAALVAAVFLLHPLQTEAVLYVNSLGDSLGTLFILLGLLFYTRYRQDVTAANYWLALAMFPLALMSKETGFVFFALLMTMDFLLLSPQPRWGARVKDVLAKSIPFLLTAAAYLLLRATVLNFGQSFNFYNTPNVFTQNVMVRVWTFGKALTTYVSLLFYPAGLHVERTLVPLPSAITSPGVLPGVAVFVMILTVLVWAWRSRPLVAFGAAWFLIALAPVSNIVVPINAMIYEHWVYLPMIGFFLALILLLKEAAERCRGRAVFIAVILAALAVFAFLTVERNTHWRTAEDFYNETLRYAPRSSRVLNNLGNLYLKRREFARAEEIYLRAIAVNPRQSGGTYGNLGLVYLAQDKIDEAQACLERAHAANPSNLIVYRPLLHVYLLRRDEERVRRLRDDYRSKTGQELVD